MSYFVNLAKLAKPVPKKHGERRKKEKIERCQISSFFLLSLKVLSLLGFRKTLAINGQDFRT
jgi:hypothetical protein